MVKAIRCGRWLTMATTRSWCAGSMISIVGAAPAPQLRDPLDRGRVGAGRRGQQAPAALEQRGEAGVRAGDTRCPPSGCAGTRWTPAGSSGPTSRITDCLVRPDVGDDRAGRQVRRDRRGQCRKGADRRAQHHAIRARDGAGQVGSTRSAMPRSAPAPARRAAVVGDQLAARCRRAGRRGRPSCRSARCRAGQPLEQGLRHRPSAA